MLSAGSRHVFLESFDISSERETADVLIDCVEKSIDKAKQEFGVNVYAIVSDNAANMKSMGSRMNLMYTTCNADTGNLLAKDILKKQKHHDIVDKAMRIQKAFRKPSLMAELLRLGGTKPVLYCETRWSSQRDMLTSVIKNSKFMKRISCAQEESENSPLPANVSQLLFNETFNKSINELHSMLDPVANLVNTVQGDGCPIAEAVELWLTLIETAPNELAKLATERCNKSNVFNSIALLANHFDPRYRGNKFDQNQKKIVADSLLAIPGMAELSVGYEEKEDLYGRLDNFRDPLRYWKFVLKYEEQKEIAEFALKLMRLPASTARIERLFSNWAFVHSDLRNRLSTERSKKPLNVYFSLRLNHEANFTDFSDDEEEE